MKSTSFPAHRSAFVFASFALVGGFLEAYTYILHGGVFCNAQTGNLVLFFIDAANGEWQEASHYLYSLLAYIAGILVSAALPLLLKRFSHAAVTAFEIAALAALAFLPAEAPDFYTYVSVSFLCALQYNAFTECRGAKLATTFCTNNLRQAVLNLYGGATEKNAEKLKKSGIYSLAILAFAGGAVAGALLAGRFGSYSVLFCSALLLPVFIVLIIFRNRTPSLREPPQSNACPSSEADEKFSS